jgi:hypothetical protein
MIDFKDIYESWKKSGNPTDIEKQHAFERLSICKGTTTAPKCEYYVEIVKNKKWSSLCVSCGCPIPKKIFTNKTPSCPKNKWDIIDLNYNTNIVIKNKKTIL